jgi:ribosomal protein S18 acetylase RimI-like enzyme
VQDRLAGVLGVSIDPRDKIRHKGHVFGMYVAPEYAGHGVGRALVDACIQKARALPGLEQLDLTVTDSTTRAKRLYQKAGFRPFGVAPKAIKLGDRYFDKCHMALELHTVP